MVFSVRQLLISAAFRFLPNSDELPLAKTTEELARILCRTAPLRSRLSKCNPFSGCLQSRARKQPVSSIFASSSTVCGVLGLPFRALLFTPISVDHPPLEKGRSGSSPWRFLSRQLDGKRPSR
jgi:hypothetical protein